MKASFSNIASVVLLFVFCITPSLFARDKAIVLPPGEGFAFNGKSVGILIPNPEVAYEGSLTPMFQSGDMNKAIMHFTDSAIAATLQEESIFRNVNVLKSTDVGITKVNVKSKDFVFAASDYSSLTCDIILVLSPFYLESQTRPSMLGFSRGLGIEATYAYQNAKTGEILAYGSFKDDEEGSWSVEDDNWINLVDKIVDYLLMDDEFEKDD